MKKHIILHPYLFAIYPILFLYGHNIDQVSLNIAISSILVSLSITFISLRLLSFLLKDSTKCALIVSFILVIFFSYGNIHTLLFDFSVKTFTYQANFDRANWYVRLDIFTHLYLLAWLFIITKITLRNIIKKNYKNSFNITKTLNVVAVILSVISLFKISMYLLKAEQFVQNSVAEISTTVQNIEYYPNIYYIILDGYARSDVLEKYYGFNNNEFVNFLKNRSFYVAPKSHSNFAWTFLSLPSSLNLEYINYLADKVGSDSTDLRIPYEMIKNNKVARFLKSKGYLFIHFNSTWGATQSNSYADIEIEYKEGIFKDEFIRVLSQTTLLKIFDSLIVEDLAATHLYTFEKLDKITRIKEPKFMFLHILMPHHPYRFDRYGNVKEHVTRLNQFQKEMWQKKNEYVDQLIFVNKKIEVAIDGILEQSDYPPIIIVQSDHGPQVPNINRKNFMINRMKNFSAFYLPGGGDKLLYPTITPVNTFRLIFNYYFGTSLPLLEDKIYFSQYSRPYNFLRISP